MGLLFILGSRGGDSGRFCRACVIFWIRLGPLEATSEIWGGLDVHLKASLVSLGLTFEVFGNLRANFWGLLGEFSDLWEGFGDILGHFRFP